MLGNGGQTKMHTYMYGHVCEGKMKGAERNDSLENHSGLIDSRQSLSNLSFGAFVSRHCFLPPVPGIANSNNKNKEPIHFA